MSWKLKYDFQYYPLWAANPNIVQIWHNTDSDVVYEAITGHKSPFVLELPEIKHKFQVVRGKGCTVNLLSESDMKFFNSLYHVDPQEFMIKHYRGDKNGDPDFFGYLNAEMMTEPYDFDRNYQVTFTCNDGFSLMDRFSFVQSDGTNYTGIKSKFEILQIIFAKIALPYDQYRIALSTTFADFSGAADSTILHESYVDCSNFYNEDPAPMSLREVVESILAPYGAFITAQDGHIYITDINTLAADGNITYKQFGLTSGNYVGTVVVNNEKSISNIGYMGTGQSIEKSGGVNKQVVAYSPYPVKNLFDISLNAADEFDALAPFTLQNGFYLRTMSTNKTWLDVAGAGILFEASKYNLNEEASFYIKIPPLVSSNVIARTKISPYLSVNEIEVDGFGNVTKGIKAVMTGKMLLKTKTNPYNKKQYDGIKYYFNDILTRIKCGNKYYVGANVSESYPSAVWQDTPGTFTINSSKQDLTYINNQWIDLGVGGSGVPIYFENSVSGKLSIEIYDYGIFNWCWLKDIEVKITDWDGNEIPDNNIEYIGLLDKTFQDEGEKIVLTCGTDSTWVDRGKIMMLKDGEYKHITAWTRAGQTFKIEELLLNSLSSNYRAGFISLLSMKLQNKFDLMNVLTDTFIGSKKLMIKSASVNYEDNAVECSLVEISPDSLTIVPSEVVGAN